ncbi:MAG TPA: LysR family transcriptional regulator [Pseudolabrys sp.]|nr:LysR family transcriptional regulator [Pseudolabrys sp.]
MVRDVNLKQLRLLAAAARGGSFAAAAETCHVTPPAVTMQMQQLEAAAGLPLFDRNGRGFALTAAGRELLACAEKIEAVLADCAAGLAELKSLASGRVTVGVVSTAKYFAPQMLAAFARVHPTIEIELVIGNREDTIAAFKEGRFDIAVMGRPPEGVEVESAPIGQHPQVIIAPPDHPLVKRRAIPPRDIAGEKMLMREPGSGTRLLAERFLAKHGIKPRISMEISSNETIKQAVIAGLGIAFISAHTIAAELADHRLAVLDVVGLPEMRQWFVVRPAAKRLMPAARALRDFLVAEGRQFLPAAVEASAPASKPARRRSKSAKQGAERRSTHR